MATSGKRLGLAGLLSTALCLAVGGYSFAQPRPAAQPRDGNPYRNVGVNQGAFNPTGLSGQLYSNVPTAGQQDGLAQASAIINSPRGLIPGLLTQPYPDYGGGYGGSPYGAIFSGGGMPYGGGYGGYSPLTPNVPGSAVAPPFTGVANNPGYSYLQEYSSFNQDHSGYLRGISDVMNASGNLQIQSQQARLIGQQYQLGKVALKRAMWDQWAFERQNMPTLQQFLAESKANRLARTLISAPITEILAGDSLNTLVNDLKEKSDSGLRGNAVPIGDDILQHINVTTPRGGNLGVLRPLREGNSLDWPISLESDFFKEDIRTINARAKDALDRVERQGKVDPGTYNDLTAAVERLEDKVARNVAGMGPTQWIDAKEYVRSLKQSLRALEQKDVSKFFVKGKTVPDLVKYMAENGLKFAPAVNGDEFAYQALYNYLMTYRSSLASPGGSNQ